MIDASKYMPWRPLGEGPIYTGEQIWLPQLGAQAMAARTPVITGKTFIDCRIEGPAVLAALGACEFDACDLGFSSGDIRNLLLGPVGEKITVRSCSRSASSSAAPSSPSVSPARRRS